MKGPLRSLSYMQCIHVSVSCSEGATKGKRKRKAPAEPKPKPEPKPKKQPAKSAKTPKSGKQEKITDTFKVKRKVDRFNGVPEADILAKTLPDILTFNLDIVIVSKQ